MATYPKSLTIEQYQRLITGLPKRAAGAVFTLGGQTYTAAQLVAMVQQILTATAGVGIAKARWLEAIDNAAALEASDGQTVKGVREILALQFKQDPVALADLGIEPKKPRTPLSADALLVKAAKARATREARGTKSKKQRARIKGAVVGVTIEPVTKDEGAAKGGEPSGVD